MAGKRVGQRGNGVGVLSALLLGERVPTWVLRRLRGHEWLHICRALHANGWRLRHETTHAVPLPPECEWWAERRAGAGAGGEQ